MADNLGIATGSNATVFTDERIIAGQTGHAPRVIGLGAASIATANASVTTTSAEAVALRETRRRVHLKARDTNTAALTIGVSGVSSGAAWTLSAGDAITLETIAAIHADAASGTQTLEVIEEYD